MNEYAATLWEWASGVHWTFWVMVAAGATGWLLDRRLAARYASAHEPPRDE